MVLKKIVLFSMFFLAAGGVAMRPVCAGQEMVYTVQVEMLSFEPAARVVMNRLIARGYDAYIETSTAQSRKFYQVRFGRYATRREADAAAQGYRSNEQRDCFVVRTVRSGQLAAQRQEPPQQQAPVAPADAQGGTFYTVQIAAKTDASVAREYAARLQQAGYPAYVVDPAPDDVRPFYRVRIGRYANRGQAKQVGRTYAERERGEFLVVLSAADRLSEEEPAKPAASVPEVSDTSPVFTVQVCVRESRAVAERYADQVRAIGFEPYVTTHETAAGKILYRVRMGMFEKRSQAEDYAREYVRRGGREYLVVRTERSPTRRDPAVLPAPDQPRVALLAEEPLSDDESDIQPAPGAPKPSGGIAAADPGLLQDSGVSRPADWPETVSKIFAYTGPRNELHLTNAYADIPESLLERIKYVSIFPVMFVDVSETGSVFVFEVEGARRRVRLSGIQLPEEDRVRAIAGIQEYLSGVPLRLKYSPADERASLLTGTLYYRSGTDIQLTLLQRGFALVDEQSVPPDRRTAFHTAQQRGRSLQAGIWSGREQTP